ncbi:matrilysin-like [Dendronephthya gigantea]|uniref:matrilysin-like n=1 Tax=Dendronephthya gigantea TaxID=151771 RepID=UPI00106AC94B|nr:matrilysin-like [Dendronephthya gigantea]
MKTVLIWGALALLSGSFGFPVSDEATDEELADKLFQEDTENNVNQKIKQDIWKYLKSYGYISETTTPMQKSEGEQIEQGMWNFAVRNGANIKKKIFKNEAKRVFERILERISKKRRCGDPDIGKGAFGTGGGIQKRYLAQSPWGKNILTYKILSFDDDLTHEVQREEIAKAFKFWTDASELTVSEVQGTTTADINIEFVVGSHSDSVPFDGPGFVVAHAFYPEDGRIHFDRDEKFTTGQATSEVNLLSVAAHEIGHALGLGHSTDSKSIMRAQYQPYSTDLALSQDDIDGITYLYPSNNAGACVDEFWCEDILKSECSFFPGYCKNKCGTC